MLLENLPWKSLEAALGQIFEEVLRKFLDGNEEAAVGEDEDCWVGHQLPIKKRLNKKTLPEAQRTQGIEFIT